MSNNSATAVACPNIAFIKYWGNRDNALRIPSNGSISMNLHGLETKTTVTFDSSLSADQLSLNGDRISGQGLQRVQRFMGRVRDIGNLDDYANIKSDNNFPTGVGIASSASAFAALALAATAAAGLQLNEKEHSRLARTGSGSACRSVPAGFVEWFAGKTDVDSYAKTIAPANHWDLRDCIAVVSQSHKSIGSSLGHPLAETSPLQPGRVADAPNRLNDCRLAFLARDFQTFTDVVEQDNNLMHAVMMTSQPALIYWLPATLAVIHAVKAWRLEGLEACYTIDAGPNVHVLCTSENVKQVIYNLKKIPGVQKVISAKPGGPARLI